MIRDWTGGLKRKMSNKIYNTVFEVSLRCILLMRECDYPLSSAKIAAADFIATYAKYFDTSQHNINGDGQFQLAEYTSRQKLVNSAIRQLVVKGFILPVESPDGFLYKLTGNGYSLATKLDSEYAHEYQSIVKGMVSKIIKMTDYELVNEINDAALKSLVWKEEG